MPCQALNFPNILGCVHRHALAVGEVGFALLDESGHALTAIIRGKGGVEEPLLEVESLLQRHLVGSVDGLLAHGDRELRVGSHLVGGFDSGVDQLVNGEHLAHETRSLRRLGVDHIPRQAHLHGFGLADRARQPLGASGARNRANADLRLTEAGLLPGVNDIAHHGQLTSAAERVAVHSRDDGLGAVGHITPEGEEVTAVDISELLVLHLLDVGSRGEGLIAAGEDHSADGRIALCRLHGIHELHH